ncbi:Gfo/Idh/MocA family protein [Kiritimatiella glycovorans]|uniref:Inositol 2-dehydrogenase n=1 Tax=Kiritimatiella glycovorans TaxID=1307763 RepID=A0A0G3EM53_9BACT|nr:Gfo/Idh/MocA family oxidoreductase [Kiritimatiella glycovorans]AKJ65244.1 Inositol 2-dehydrogenase [Kiritimatiella glycovorans]
MNDRPSSVSRRGFLRRSTLAAASTAAAPYVIPSSALGLNGIVPPSERIVLGLIGLGKISRGHFGSMLNHPGVQIAAVCDVDRTKREDKKTAAESRYAQNRPSGTWRGVDAYNEYERIVERDDIDACFVMTPDHWHVPIAMAAVRSGQDVYCEKPMSLTIREGRMLSDAVRRYGRVLQVGSQQRSNTAFRRAAEIVRNGWIGKVHTIYARLGTFPPPLALPEQPVPEGFDYDRWLGRAPWHPYHPERVSGSFSRGWRRFWDYGSRKNGDWGAHHYDIIQWALGMQYSGPEFFFPVGHEGSEHQGFRYADGTTVLRDHPAPSGQMIHFIGEDGVVAVSRRDVLITEPAHLATLPLSPSDEHLYVSDNHRENFLECVRSRRHPIADVEIGHRTATICHLSAISERLGRTLKWDPDREAILGNREASRWMARPRRAPYTL